MLIKEINIIGDVILKKANVSCSFQIFELSQFFHLQMSQYTHTIFSFDIQRKESSTGGHLAFWGTKAPEFQIENQAIFSRYVPKWSPVENAGRWKRTRTLWTARKRKSTRRRGDNSSDTAEIGKNEQNFLYSKANTSKKLWPGQGFFSGKSQIPSVFRQSIFAISPKQFGHIERNQ